MATNKSKIPKTKYKILVLMLPIFFLLSSNFVFAEASAEPGSSGYQIVPCTGVQEYLKDANGKQTTTPDPKSVPCDYNALITGVNRVIKYFFIIVIMAIPVMLTYAGFLYYSSTDNPGNKKKAIHMLKSVAIGTFWVFFAYLLVYSLLKWLIPEGSPFITQTGKSVEDVIQLSK